VVVKGLVKAKPYVGGFFLLTPVTVNCGEKKPNDINSIRKE